MDLDSLRLGGGSQAVDVISTTILLTPTHYQLLTAEAVRAAIAAAVAVPQLRPVYALDSTIITDGYKGAVIYDDSAYAGTTIYTLDPTISDGFEATFVFRTNANAIRVAGGTGCLIMMNGNLADYVETAMEGASITITKVWSGGTHRFAVKAYQGTWTVG